MRASLSTLILLYTLVFLALIFAVWIFYEMLRKSSERRSLGGKVRCAICGLVYPGGDGVGPFRCPRCETLNENQKIKIF